MTNSTKQQLLIAAGIVLVGLLCYANSLNAPFIFDDDWSIKDNQTIRVLWPLRVPLSPPTDGQAVQARPLVNFSFALNYAAGGLDVRGYHLVNLALHLVAALALFGLVRRTLLSPALGKQYGGVALPLAAAVAALWVAHPLNSEAVTYIVQRTESLMGMCYLLTLYCATRSAELSAGRRRAGWSAAAVACCAAGTACKEVIATAPLIVLLHDRAFFAGSFRRALAKRPYFYLGLAATWGLLAWFVLPSMRQGRFATDGFDCGVTSWEYLRTQFGVVTHYLRLAFWPDHLVVDYGTGLAGSLREVLPQAVLLGLLMLGAIWLSIRNRPLGFLGMWFFLILLPSSSIVPLATQTAAEKRMYLSLAALIAAVIIGVFTCWRRLAIRAAIPQRARVVGVGLAALAVGALIAAAATRTVLRNRDYQSHHRLFEEAIERNPANARAHINLAGALAAEGRPDLAVAQYRLALTFGEDPLCRCKLAGALSAIGLTAEAVTQSAHVVALEPGNPQFRLAYAQCLEQDQRLDAAAKQYERVLRVQPETMVALNNLAWLIANHPEKTWHNLARATALAETACRLAPDNPSYLDTLAGVYAARGKFEDAARIGRLAVEAAKAAGSTGHVSKLEQRLERYLKNQPRKD